MYRVAVVQNESEMLRYGWADLKPLLGGIEYDFVYFTAERLADLFAELELDRYDSLILATNACNDARIKAALEAAGNKQVLGQFLAAGGGVFLSFQMRLTGSPEYGFLPATFELAAVNRPEPGTSGAISIPLHHSDHIIFKHPHRVTDRDITRKCLENEFVQSLYRGYLCSRNEAAYDAVLIDPTSEPARPLILCARSDFAGRLVASAIPLDWQGHQALLENVVRYITAGQPYLALVEKRSVAAAFDQRYFAASLEVSKIPFSRYVQDNLLFGSINATIHNTIVLDPAWNSQDLANSDYRKFARGLRSPIRLVFFDVLNTGDPVVSSTSGVRDVQLMQAASVAWLRAQYCDGRWGGSFWQTFDVIETFVSLGIGVDEYRAGVLQSIEPHNIRGSYDEVIGATCAMLKIYDWLLGKKDRRYRDSLAWLRRRVHTAGEYEQATVLDTLNEIGEPLDVPDAELIIQRLGATASGLSDEIRVYRYAKTILSSGCVEEAQQLVRRLQPHQSADGGWLNVARTASIVLLLMKLQRHLKIRDDLIDEMVFRGITYIRGMYDQTNCSWHGDVSATARALEALLEFQRRIVYPIDELMHTIEATHRRAQEFRGLQVASDHNARLEAERASLVARVKQESAHSAISRVLAALLAVVAVPLATLSVILSGHSLWSGKWPAFVAYLKLVVTDWSLLESTSVVLVPTAVLYLLLRAINMIPRLKVIPEEWEDWILRSVFKARLTEKPE